MLFCCVFSLFSNCDKLQPPFSAERNNTLNQSQRTILHTVDSTGNGGALNTPGIQVFLICFVFSDQQNKQK